MRWPRFRSHTPKPAEPFQPVIRTDLRKYVLDCRIESGAHLYYAIARDGSVEHVQEPHFNVTLVSAVYAPPGRMDDDTADDFRFNLPRKMSASQASGYIQRELGLFSKLRSIVSVSGGYAAWAAAEDKVLSKGRVVPFSWPLERLMAQDNLIPPCVTGVLFGESDLLILMAYPGNGRAFVQTSVSPDNLAEIITSFAAANSISVDIDTLPIYTGSEFLQALASTPSYPLDTDVMGISVSGLARTGLSISAFALLGSAGGSFYIGQQMHAVRIQTESFVLQKQRVTQAMLKRMESNSVVLSQAMSVDYPEMFRHASAFWVQDGRVESVAVSGRETHTLVLPLQGSHHAVSGMALADALKTVGLPDTCRYVGYTLSSTASELRVQYECDRGRDVLASME